MLSCAHEIIVELFRNRPELAARLLRETARLTIPEGEARIDSVDFAQVQPTEYRADAVVTLLHPERRNPVLSIVVEVQLRADERKRFTWPVYITTLRARLECPVYLLVVTHHASTARWCSQPIDLGSGYVLPLAVGPEEVPVVVDAQEAKASPELAILSVIAHGQHRDPQIAASIASAAEQAVVGLDDDLAVMYLDVILSSLSDGARTELATMIPGYEFQSEFVRTHFFKARQEGMAAGVAEGIAKGHAEGLAKGQAEGLAKGQAEGLAEGRAEIVLKQLTLRYGDLSSTVVECVRTACAEDLERIARQLLTAPSLDEALAR
jgi:Domain of unknown function (DUF4351)